MNSGNRPPYRIRQQDRHAICRPDSDKHSRLIGHNPVAISNSVTANAPHLKHAAGMDLPQGSNVFRVGGIPLPESMSEPVEL